MTTLTDPTLEQVATAADICVAMMLERQRERLLEAYRRLTPEQQRNVIAELAELDASRDTMETELSDAGFASFGPL